MNPYDSLMSRRELVESAVRASLASGGMAFFAAWLSAQGHQHEPEPELLTRYAPQFFSPADFEALQAFTEILIPTDGTPGAHESHCGHYIDFVLHASGELPKVQDNWRNAMQALTEAGFHQASATRRFEMVSQMAQYELSPPAADSLPRTYFAYKLIKQQTAFAFYTSRQGMIDTLDYKGNSYNLAFPACEHPEHKVV
jgi:hypothetical protein